MLEEIGVERAHVLGVSRGAAVAQELAKGFSDRVDRLVLVSTGYWIPGVIGSPGVLVRFLRPWAYGDLAGLESKAAAIFGGRLRREPEPVHRWHLRPPRSLHADLRRLLGTTGWSSLPWLHRISGPTLVVHGDDDPIVPLVNVMFWPGGSRRAPCTWFGVAVTCCSWTAPTKCSVSSPPFPTRPDMTRASAADDSGNAS